MSPVNSRLFNAVVRVQYVQVLLPRNFETGRAPLPDLTSSRHCEPLKCLGLLSFTGMVAPRSGNVVGCEAMIMAVKSVTTAKKRKSKPFCPAGLCPPPLKGLLRKSRRGPLLRTRAYGHSFFLRHRDHLVHRSGEALRISRVETWNLLLTPVPSVRNK